MPSKISEIKKDYRNHVKDHEKVLDDPGMHVNDDIRSTYDMWQWIFNEIANLRLEVSRLGVMVRINNENSPAALRAYHSHIYSLLIPVSVVVKDSLWIKIESMWKSAEEEISNFETQRLSIPNKKIPKILIEKLDKLHRAALLAAQKAGIGFRIERVVDIDKSIEVAITG